MHKLFVVKGEKKTRSGRGSGGNYRRCLARTSKGGSRDGAVLEMFGRAAKEIVRVQRVVSLESRRREQVATSLTRFST